MKPWKDMSDSERLAELDTRVSQYKSMSLLGQREIMFMGTYKLIDLLWD